MRRPVLIALAAAAVALALPAAAQKVTEVNFYYPVAVGGPVTKTIDQMAADFAQALLEKEHVAVTPGEGFDAPGFFRLSYAASRRSSRCCCRPTCSR